MTKPTLLIVDDDPLISDSLEFVLGDSFQISKAATRREAMQAARANRPDLALVDLGLPPAPHTPSEGLALISELLAIPHKREFNCP